MEESSQLQVNLEKEGNGYLPVAQFASKLYFTITDLLKLNNMYRMSLAAFMNLFKKTLKSSPHAGSSSDQRINALCHYLQAYVYQYVSRSLFKADRLTFAMHLSHGMHKELFQENEWEAFTGLHIGGQEDNVSIPEWVDDTNKAAVRKLKASFPKICEALQLDDNSCGAVLMKNYQFKFQRPSLLSNKYLHIKLLSQKGWQRPWRTLHQELSV